MKFQTKGIIKCNGVYFSVNDKAEIEFIKDGIDYKGVV